MDFDFDVLDLHFYLRHHLDSRGRDGIHWDYWAHRTISSMILTHICEAWNLPQPIMRKTFKSYGSRSIRHGEPQHQPATFSFGQAQNQIHYPRTANLNNLQFQFGQQNSYLPRSSSLNSSRMLSGYNGPHTQKIPTLASTAWMPYQQNDCYGHTPSTHRSRHTPYHSRSENEYRARRYWLDVGLQTILLNVIWFSGKWQLWSC